MLNFLAQRAALVAFITLGGCGLVAFDVDQAIPEQSVPGNPLGATLPTFLPSPFPFTINVKEEEAAHDTSIVSSATLSSLTFSATPHSAPSGNFDFLNEVHVSISAPSNSALPALEIANAAPVGKGLTVLKLNVVPHIDLLPYINAGPQISATATGTAPAQTFTYDGEIIITLHI